MAKSKDPSRKKQQDELLEVIGHQFLLSRIETETDNPKVIDKIQAFWRKGEKNGKGEWLASKSNEYVKNIAVEVKEIQSMFDSFSQTSGADNAITGSSLPSSANTSRLSAEHRAQKPATFGRPSSVGSTERVRFSTLYVHKSQVMIQVALERGVGSRVMMFSEEQGRTQFLQKIAELFPDDEMGPVTISPHQWFHLPTERKIGEDQAGDRSWKLVREELIQLSECPEDPYEVVKVDALVHARK